MKLIFTALICLLSVIAMGQSFSSFVNYIDNLPDAASKSIALDSFMNEFSTAGFPYIEVDTANFIYRGNATTVGVAGDFNGWDFNTSPLVNLFNTDFWYRSITFEPHARMDYKLVVNASNWILDPLNPNMVSGGFGPNSEIAMPAYVQPWEIDEYATTSKGVMETISLSSTNTGSTYQVQIYLPAEYDPNGMVTYPTAYFQDGTEYVSLGDAKNIFDNLIDSNLISATIGVFVRPTDRNVEYAGSKRTAYRQFFVNELVPYIDQNYRTYATASRRAVIGASYGGNISALISYNHPDVFGNCGIHSGAFQPNGYEAYNLVVNGGIKDIRFASVWGSYEGSLSNNNHDFKDDLDSKGYDLWWNELPEGHSWGLWRATTDDLLKHLFPVGLTAISEEEINVFDQIRVYPNPGSDVIRIEYRNPLNQKHTFSIIDSSGKIVEVISSTAAVITINDLPAGKYIAKSNFGHKIQFISTRQ